MLRRQRRLRRGSARPAARIRRRPPPVATGRSSATAGPPCRAYRRSLRGLKGPCRGSRRRSTTRQRRQGRSNINPNPVRAGTRSCVGAASAYPEMTCACSPPRQRTKPPGRHATGENPDTSGQGAGSPPSVASRAAGRSPLHVRERLPERAISAICAVRTFEPSGSYVHRGGADRRRRRSLPQ